MTFGERLSGALRLDVATFEEIEANHAVTRQAVAVVVAASVAAGIGFGGFDDAFAMIDAMIRALLLWVIWSGVTYLVGTRLLPEPQTSSDIGEMLRVFGFASAPSLFSVLGIIPFLGWLLKAAVAVWVFVATVIAVRQALDYTSTGRALGVVIVSWLLVLLVQVVLFR